MFTTMGSFQLPNSVNQTYHNQYPGISNGHTLDAQENIITFQKAFQDGKTSTIEHRSFLYWISSKLSTKKILVCPSEENHFMVHI